MFKCNLTVGYSAGGDHSYYNIYQSNNDRKKKISLTVLADRHITTRVGNDASNCINEITFRIYIKIF